jgi:hypothetical protein
MNYCLDFSLRVEARMNDITQKNCEGTRRSSDTLSAEGELQIYETVLAEVLEEDEGRTWAGGEVRIGEIILLIDSDSRVVSLSLSNARPLHNLC